MDAVFCSDIYIYVYRLYTIVAVSTLFNVMAIVSCFHDERRQYTKGASPLGRSIKLKKTVAQVDVGWAEKSAEFSFLLTLLILSEAH
jgi:hypothetical protein